MSKHATDVNSSDVRPLYNDKHDEFMFNIPVESIKNHRISARFQKGHENMISQRIPTMTVNSYSSLP